MAAKLIGTVGKNSRNDMADVITVGTLLDRFIEAGLLPPRRRLTVIPDQTGEIPDSKMKELIKRIRQFERDVVGTERAPGFVTKSGETIKWLEKPINDVKKRMKEVEAARAVKEGRPTPTTGKSTKLTGTVGNNSKNDITDVVTVGILLDRLIEAGLLPPQKVLTIIPGGDGKIPPAKMQAMIKRIRQFERDVLGSDHPPGFITKNGPAIEWLQASIAEVRKQIEKVREKRKAMDKPVKDWTRTQKLEEAVQRSIPLMSPSAGLILEKMLTPEAVATMTAIVTAWAVSHFFGVGEIADVVLLIIGVAALGAAAVEATDHLLEFGQGALYAKRSSDLDRAAVHFAKAVSLIGVEVVAAILFKKRPKGVYKGKTFNPRTPAPKNGRLRYVPKSPAEAKLPRGHKGGINEWGDVLYDPRHHSGPKDIKTTILHEKVHSFLTPKLKPLRSIRVKLRVNAHNKSALLRYVEEALAETIAQVGVNGARFRNVIRGLKFPVRNGEVKLMEMCREGKAILLGPVNVAGMTWSAYFEPS